MEPTEQDDQLDLQVNVVERPTGSFSFGAGYSSQDGLVLTGSLVADEPLRARLRRERLRRPRRQHAALLRQPDRPRTSSARPSASARRSRAPTLTTRTSSRSRPARDVVLGHALTEDNRARGFLRYSFSQRKLDENANVNAAGADLPRDPRRTSVTTQPGRRLGGARTRATTASRRSRAERIGLSLEGAGPRRLLAVPARRGARVLLPRRAALAARPLDLRASHCARGLGGAVQRHRRLRPSEPRRARPADRPATSQPLDQIDDDLELPLTERYFLGGLGNFQLRGFNARSVGPRRAILHEATAGTRACSRRSASIRDDRERATDDDGQPASAATATASATSLGPRTSTTSTISTRPT